MLFKQIKSVRLLSLTFKKMIRHTGANQHNFDKTYRVGRVPVHHFSAGIMIKGILSDFDNIFSMI